MSNTHTHSQNRLIDSVRCVRRRPKTHTHTHTHHNFTKTTPASGLVLLLNTLLLLIIYQRSLSFFLLLSQFSHNENFRSIIAYKHRFSRLHLTVSIQAKRRIRCRIKVNKQNLINSTAEHTNTQCSTYYVVRSSATM